jgi:membrane protein
MVIKGRNVVPLLKATGKEIGADRIPIFAAQMAYNFFFSIFPLALFMAAVLGLVASREQVTEWMNGLSAALPPDVASLFMKTLRAILDADGSAGILSFGLLTALWSGSAIIGAFMTALNAAYDVEETRPWWKRQLIRVGMLVVSALVLVASTVVLVNGEAVVNWLGRTLGLGEATRTVWTIVQFPLAIAAVVGVLWLQYYYLPNCRHQNRKYVLVGALTATVLWIAATLLFRLYVQNFGAMNPAYGAIGAIMVLLTWMYLSSLVLLAAGELNSELHHGTGRVGAEAKSGASDAKHAKHAKRAKHAARTDHEDARGSRGHGSNLPVPAREAPFAPALASARGNGDGARGARDRQHDNGDGTRGIGTLLRELADGGVILVRRELELARLELGAMARGAGIGGALVAFGGVMALLGVLALFTGLTLLPGDQWLRDQYWLAALVVTVIAGGVAAWFVKQGLGLLSPAHLKPTQTLDSLREDAAWLKHQKESMRSATTSR